MLDTFKRRTLALIHWLGGTDLFVLIGLLLLAGGVLAFLVLLDMVQAGRVQTIDEHIMVRTRAIDDEGWGSPKVAEEVGRDLTTLGGVAFMTLMTLAVTGYLVITRKYHAAALVVLATLGGLGISSLLKHVIDRPRPTVVAYRSQVMTSSFPSGHSMMA